MKSLAYLLFISFFVLAKACGDGSTSDSDGSSSSSSEPATEKSAITVSAERACDCLKPVGDYKNQFDTGKIDEIEYAEKLRETTMTIGNCMNEIYSGITSNDDRTQLASKMQDICPDVAGIVFSGQQ